MLFRLHGASATFQRVMDKVLEPVKEFAAAYIDDILIYSKTFGEHVIHLEKVLTELRQANLRVSPSKCKIARRGIKYLGFLIEEGKIWPVSEKVDKKEVQQFLGLAGYYRQFIPNCSELTAPLTDLTKKKKCKNIIWGQSEQIAFEKVKNILSGLPHRYASDFQKTFIVQTDASDREIGAVLSQNEGQKE